MAFPGDTGHFEFDAVFLRAGINVCRGDGGPAREPNQFRPPVLGGQDLASLILCVIPVRPRLDVLAFGFLGFGHGEGEYAVLVFGGDASGINGGGEGNGAIEFAESSVQNETWCSGRWIVIRKV